MHRKGLLLFVLAVGSAAPCVGAAQSAPTLVVEQREPLQGRSGFRSVGLSGAQKRNGWEQRYRVSVPERTPRYVTRSRAGLTLTIADSTADGWLAFYRSDPDGRTPTNSRFHATLFRRDGSTAWDLPLNPYLSRTTRLEIQDVRYRDGRLYFNEACQSYSREAGGRCSALVRLDPRGRRVEWRTRNLVSNDVFIFSGPYIVAGYGFTDEPDALHLVRVSDGRVAAQLRLDSAQRYLEERTGRIMVVTHNNLYTVRVRPGR